MKFLTSILLVLFSLSGFAQQGPGGVGTSANVKVWLAANDLGLTNNDPVATWPDRSGNSNDASQATPGFRPIFRTSQVNGQPAVEFDGATTALDLATNIQSGEISAFMVFSSNSPAYEIAFQTDSNIILTRSGHVGTGSSSPWKPYVLSRTNNTYSLFIYTDEGGPAGATQRIYTSSKTGFTTRNSLYNLNSSVLGARALTPGNYDLHLDGQVAEIVVFDELLNSAERNIVAEYLGAKYRQTTEKGLYSFKTNFRHDVFGIGQEADGNQTSADNDGRITFSNPSGLGNGEYLLVGHNNGNFGASTSVPTGITQRWNRTWAFDETGNVGTIDLVVDFDGAALPGSNPNNYVLLIDTDGNFANGGTTIVNASSVDIGSLTVTFNGLDVSNATVFTLGEKVGDIKSDDDGDWDVAATWDCNCIPTSENNVQIDHNVTIDANAAADDLVLSSGSLTFSGSDTLSLGGDFTLSSTFNKGSGTIAAVSTTFQQTFTNSTGSTVELHNLYVNCTDPLILTTGDWEIDNNLQISNGGLDVSGTNSTTMTSDASTISQILPSINSPFTGELILQRHISTRNANYGNFSSPIEGATFAQLDDELYLSGLTGGADGNATVGGGGIFYSVYAYNAALGKHDTIDDINDVMTQGVGYELYLATTLSTFNDTTLAYEGTPGSGDVAVTLEGGVGAWNLVGNPYHCFIDFDNLDQTNIDSDFYIYNSSTGAYNVFSFGTNTLIAPSQGFWVEKDTPGSDLFTFQESDKSESHGSAFLRRSNVKRNTFHLNIRESGSALNQDLLVRFSPHALRTYDEFDAKYLPSPIKEVPALTSQADNSEEDLIAFSTNNMDLTQIIPLELKSGKESDYIIEASDLTAVYDNYDCIYLKDKVENTLIDLSVEPTYSFTSQEGEFKRFELIVSKDYQSCQKTLDGESSDSYSQQLDQVFELRSNTNGWWLDYSFKSDYQHQTEVRVYNLSGQEVISPSRFSLEKSGTLQLNQLQELNGIYLIQIISEDEILNKTVKL